MAGPTRKQQTCVWCGRAVADVGVGRRRRYCRQSCRQRAYEQRSAVKGTDIAPDSTILTAAEAVSAMDRMFEVRCAAEDVATAAAEGAAADEIGRLCATLIDLARDAERLR